GGESREPGGAFRVASGRGQVTPRSGAKQAAALPGRALGERTGETARTDAARAAHRVPTLFCSCVLICQLYLGRTERVKPLSAPPDGARPGKLLSPGAGPAVAGRPAVRVGRLGTS